MALALVLVAGLAPQAGAAEPVKTPVIAIFGDSLIGDAVPFPDFYLGLAGYQVLHYEYAGTALCDSFTGYQNLPATTTAVVMAFTGNAFTPCMQGRDWYSAYLQDATKAAQIFVQQHKLVVWAIPPNRVGQPITPDNPIGDIYKSVAARYNQRVADTTPLLSQNGYYVMDMPCLTGEGSAQGCNNGLIQVRSENGTHFCPGTQWPCEVYSSGARRYSETIAHAVAAAGLNPSLTPGATNPAVRQATIATTICTVGYTKTTRKVSTSTRNRVYTEYHVSKADRSKYVIDQLVPVEVGGSNAIANLWPQPSSAAKRKDVVEGELHDRVCSGSVDLATAQQAFIENWHTASATASTATTTTTLPPTTAPPPT